MNHYGMSELIASNPNNAGRRKRSAPEPGAHHADYVPKVRLDSFFASLCPKREDFDAREKALIEAARLRTVARLAKGWRR